MSSPRLQRLLILGICLLTAGVYAPTYWGQWAYEDMYRSTLMGAYDSWFLGRTAEQATFLWTVQLGGSYGAMHLTNVLWHVANGLLVYLVALALLEDRAAAIVALWVFLAHPIQSEVVSYLGVRSELVITTGCLVAVWSVLAQRRLWIRLLVGILGTAVALAGKEVGVIVFGWILVAGIYRRWHWWTWLVLLLGTECVAWVLSDALRAVLIRAQASSADDGWIRYVAVQSAAIWRYAALLIVPWGQTVDHQIELVPTWVGLVAMAGLGVVGWMAWRIRQSAAVVTLAVAWIAVDLGPRFLTRLPEYLKEHHTYRPMIAVAILCGWAWLELVRRPSIGTPLIGPGDVL